MWWVGLILLGMLRAWSAEYTMTLIHSPDVASQGLNIAAADQQVIVTSEVTGPSFMPVGKAIDTTGALRLSLANAKPAGAGEGWVAFYSGLRTLSLYRAPYTNHVEVELPFYNGSVVSFEGNRFSVAGDKLAVFSETNGNWGLTAVLPKPDDGNASFGISSVTHGDYWFLGSSASTNSAGVATGVLYIYRWDGTNYTFVRKIEPPTGFAGGRFGHSLSTDGQSLAVGQDGLITLYDINAEGLQYLQTIPLEGASHFDLKNGRLIVGTPNRNEAQRASGAAFIYRKINGQWMETEKLTQPDAHEYDHFGIGVSVVRNGYAVSAPRAPNGDNPIAGCIYVFAETLPDLRLDIRISERSLQLRWPAAYPSAFVETAAGLSGEWRAITDPAQPDGSNLLLEHAMDNSQTFFRLRF